MGKWVCVGGGEQQGSPEPGSWLAEEHGGGVPGPEWRGGEGQKPGRGWKSLLCSPNMSQYLATRPSPRLGPDRVRVAPLFLSSGLRITTAKML